MKYKIALYESDEGYSVSCPGLPGCWSRGATRDEAIENIQDAVTEYLAAVDLLMEGAGIKEIEIPVLGMVSMSRGLYWTSLKRTRLRSNIGLNSHASDRDKFGLANRLFQRHSMAGVLKESEDRFPVRPPAVVFWPWS